jgi:hypothetical protein
MTLNFIAVVDVFYDVNKIIALPKIAHELQVNAPSSS